MVKIKIVGNDKITGAFLFQEQCVRLLRVQAGNYSVDSRLANRKKIKTELKSKSDGLEMAARFIERIEIEL